MEFSQLSRMNEKIQELYSAMLAVMPLERMDEDPFDYFRNETDHIVETMETVLRDVGNRKLEMQQEIDALVSEMRKNCADIEVPMPSVPDLCNLSVVREYVKNESGRIMVLKKGIEGRMETVIEEIEQIKGEIFDIGMEDIRCTELMPMKGEDCVSVVNLRELEVYRDSLRNKREGMERSRDRLYGELCVFLSQLSKEDTEVRIDQKIFVLEGLHKKYKEEVERKDLEFRGLEAEIRRREGYLGMPYKEIEMDLSDENMALMRKYGEHLRREQERQLDEIYEKKRCLLRSLLDVFGEDMKDYKRTEEDIEEMSRTIERLESKKDLFLSIRSLMEKRAGLVDKMNEFEKIASDPKRLFRSSLQLLSEEKFRNSAYPNLIRVEEAIFKLLDEYEDRFGKLLKDGVDFKESLRKEVENRIVNKTVFISRFDSPSRKKR
ncbi:hypothetical protein [Encephalitozoon cuniculi GB-M1]|uniref:Uncharacterized protein n=2 Tax=Encephalitozoon cuniculi TaxID=6035 RepID=Q8SVM0_ENCCU|nr:uncharacterized protein ECU05_0430 [Encephalitozoon cuniculi GB-M1]AGE95383.1 hypothetical protein ECU05_0430 [Encephalitozoon cuniculi]KMV66097.1 hypothetical protein M970_050380 [Encephalitozoon cuniculi EcunIII-L]UYI27832.1 hypothetical protein J0A71_08g17190 [Encephalitozoon cuniculi]CAD26561.1 hypothetical protein [Encephalitozoon cuniculi GB-M1]